MRFRNLLLAFFTLLVSSTFVNAQSIVVNGSVPSTGAQTGSCFYNNSFSFSVNTLSNTATYAWDFGDNSTSTSATPTHGYAAAGTYKIHVDAVDAGVTYSLDQAINVYPSPVASFNSLAGTVNGNSYTFLSTSTVGSGIISGYVWSFGDGSGDVISNPTKTYSATGNYNVKLIVTSDHGCIDSTSQSVNIILTGNTIASAFTIDNASQCLLANSFNFTNAGTFDASLSYSWNFGDGTSANTFSASHTYTASGNYNVVLTVSNGSNVGTSVNTIAVLSNPIAGFTYTFNGKTANFTSTSTGSITGFAWDFGDAATASTTNTTITHTYAAPQTLSVQLVALSTGGCTDTTHQSITIVDNPNAASFTVDAPMCITNNNYHFTNTSVTNGTGVTYNWDFSDGVTDNSSSPTHSFSTAGIHTVTLTVTSSVGTSAATGTVTVYPKPTVSFTINSNNANYTYTNTSSIASGYIANNSWSSTSGNASSSVNFYETVTAGTYTVKLIETSDNGCVDSLSQSVTYSPVVIASLTASFNVTGTASGICYDNANSYTFNNTSSAGAGVTYAWDFGDGTTDNSISPNHHYATSGDYTVKLEVDSAGLNATTIQSISLYPIPTPVYILYLNTDLTDVTNLHRCFMPGMDFSYISNSKIDKGLMNYSWDFATNGKTFRDGDSAYINPRMIFNQAGTYPVKLTVTSDKGCKDSITHIVYLSQPVSSFTTTVDYSGDSTNNPLVTFTSTSHDPGGIIVNNDWFYENDGSGYQESNGAANTLATHFTKGGSYNDKLLVTSDAGCVVSSGDVNLTFYIKPIATFTADTTYNNLGQPVAATSNTSSVNETPQSLSYTWSFGDGSALSNSTQPSHTYKTGAASRTITLIVTNNNGSKVSSATTTLNGMYIKPFAHLTATATNGVLSFDATHSVVHDLGGSLTYSFDFGDTTTGTTASGTHTYASGAATRTIKVIVTNTNGGLQDSAFVTLSNVYITPIAQFTTSIADLSVTYDASTSYVNDLGGSLTYNWTFGDGGTSTTPTGTYAYNADGDYTITLTVTNANGNVVSVPVTKLVSVVAPTPVANITAFYANFGGTATYNLAGDNVSNPSTISSGSIVSYDWAWDLVSSIGDTTVGIGSTGSVLTSDPIPNGYTLIAILTVTSDKGKTATDTAIFDPTNNFFKGYKYALFGSHSNGNNHITVPATAPIAAVSMANIYPNPANNDISLKVLCTKTGNLTIKIYTVDGKMIKQQTISGGVVNTTLTTHIDISSLAKGTYLTEVTNADGKVVAIAKLLKAK